MAKIYIHIISLLSIVLIHLDIVAQQSTDSSIQMPDYIMKGSLNKAYNETKNSYSIDFGYKDLFQQENLSDQLQFIFPIYMKNYGSQMSSGISMRGTGSEHTSVNWNGFNINSATLGVASFSSLYLNLADQIYIQPGGSSATNGSGSVGGSVNLDDDVVLQSKPQTNYRVNIGAGSFNSISGYAEYGKYNQKFSWVGKVLYNQSDNNFIYKDPNAIDTYILNEGSAYKNLHLKLNLALRITKKILMKSYHWFENSDKNLQQGMNTVYMQQVLIDHNYKGIIQFEYKINNKLQVNYRNALFVDNGKYNSIYQNNLNQLQRMVSDIYLSYLPHRKLQLKAGLVWQNFKLGNTTNYISNAGENRIDLYLFSKWDINKKWLMNTNLRQPMVDGNLKSFCYDWGLKGLLLSKPNHKLIYMVNISNNYRLPTLNERFWQPGGNRNLLPELSKSAETTLKYQFKYHRLTEQVSTTVYHNQIQNWLQWIPGSSGVWEARNIKTVETKGFEFQHDFLYTTKKLNIGWRASYIYNWSTVLSNNGYNENNQLIYTPYNIINSVLMFKYKNWIASISDSYTGFRFTTTDNQNWLPAYNLINLAMQKAIDYKGVHYSVALQINNIFGVNYQTVENFAMPGRSIFIKFQLNNK